MELDRWRSQLRKGAAELAVLACLERTESYGLDLLERVVADGGLALTEGTLYPLLHRLQRDGKIESRWVEDEGASHPRKYYRLTDDGATLLAAMKDEWSQFSRGITRLIEKES